MKKEWLLTISITTVTILISLVLIRLLAPHLLGGSQDLQLVRVSKEVPPFFDNVFRKDDYQSQNFILQDPHIKRAKPLLQEQENFGPHDILGFRNRTIHNIVDIVVIGDSQTYGNNVQYENNWPNLMNKSFTRNKPVTYSMAVGGWGAAEYLAVFYKAVLFHPSVIVVAFYTGNDSLETYQQAYGNNRYAFLKMDQSLKAGDIPKADFPPPESEWWPVKFRDSVQTIFTPKLRLASNQQHPAVKAGYSAMAEAGRLMGEAARKNNIKLVFTIIPTKEMVYARKVSSEFIKQPPDYTKLITDERENIRILEQHLRAIPNAFFIDVLNPLQEEANKGVQLYPFNENGHPITAGYAIIAHTLGPIVYSLFPEPLDGLVAVHQGGNQYRLFFVRDGRVWRISNHEIASKNGWNIKKIRTVDLYRIQRMPIVGTMDRLDRTLFGPR